MWNACHPRKEFQMKTVKCPVCQAEIATDDDDDTVYVCWDCDDKEYDEEE
jgi:hypothetical protein